MIKNLKILNFVFLFLSIILCNNSYSDVINKITIKGNKRISTETIKMFSNVKLNDNINVQDLDNILKNIYSSNFFDDVKIIFNNNILEIIVFESPIIENINYEGIKSQSLKNDLFSNLLFLNF